MKWSQKGAAFVAGVIGGSLACLSAVAAAAEKPAYSTGASDKEIRLGHTTAYSGPVSAFGAGGRTYKALFDMVNAAGGIHGRKVTLISLDDAYSPPKALEQTRKLVESDDVLLIFGVSGTPTNTATQKYLNGKQVPQVLIATGAGKFNDPKTFPWTMPFWPSYSIEQKIYVDYILRHKPDAKIGVLYANDDYGKDHLNGVRAALDAQGKSKLLVSSQSYETSDAVVDSQVLNLKDSGANVFISATTPKFAAQAIRKAHEIGWKPLQFVANASASVSHVLIPAGAEASTGVITANYAKAPDDPDLVDDPEVKDYLAFMRKWNAQENPNDFYALSAYIIGNMMKTVLERAGDNLTRENIMKLVGNIDNERMPMQQKKIVLRTTPDNFSAYQTLQLQKFDGKKWVNMD